jgi:1,4-alpha-glucan branching enzyme
MTPVPRPGYRVGVPWEGEWEVLLDTDGPQWGGSGYGGYDTEGQTLVATSEFPWQGQPASITLSLPPLSVIWLAARR